MHAPTSLTRRLAAAIAVIGGAALALSASSGGFAVAAGQAPTGSTQSATPSAPPSTTATRTTIDVSKLGPQVGEQVPDFSLTDQNGKVWTRDSIMGPKGAMLVFIRSADW